MKRSKRRKKIEWEEEDCRGGRELKGRKRSEGKQEDCRG